MVIEQNGTPQGWIVEDWEDVLELFLPYLQKAKFCRKGERGCFPEKVYKDLTNQNVDGMASVAAIQLNDGSVLTIEAQIGIEQSLLCEGLSKACFQFSIDLNGKKLPNRWGVDTFTLVTTEKKLIPRGAAGTHGRQTMCDPQGSSPAGWWNGSGCGSWVLMKENMDYLKCVKGNQKYCGQKYYFD